MTPQLQQESKQQQRYWQQQGSQQQQDASFKQGTPAGEVTTSTAKTSATAESLWKNYKSGRK
jgi:hypothetical protein